MEEVGDEQLSALSKQVAEILEGEGLNLLINNAGVYIIEPMDLPTLTRVFTINAFAPLLISKVCIFCQGSMSTCDYFPKH